MWTLGFVLPVSWAGFDGLKLQTTLKLPVASNYGIIGVLMNTGADVAADFILTDEIR